MQIKNLCPEDYVRDYSSLHGDAELILWVVDEKPKEGIRALGRRMCDMWINQTTRRRDVNDVAAEQAWKVMNEKWGGISPETIARFLSDKFANDHLRKFEYAFFAHCLTYPEVRTDVIVDMGGGNAYSTVVPMLFRSPQMQILSVDVINHVATSKHNVQYVRGDCMQTNLPDESADVVALISTLEHVGLGRWGDPLDVDGDIKAMREAWRILKPGGHVVLTIPYGYPTVVFNLNRIYDAGRVSMLISGFEKVVEEYSLHGQPSARTALEGRKATTVIQGYYENVPESYRHPDAQGGILLLLHKT